MNPLRATRATVKQLPAEAEDQELATRLARGRDALRMLLDEMSAGSGAIEMKRLIVDRLKRD